MVRVLDAIDVLEAEHSRIRSLLARMASSKSPGADDRRALVGQVDAEFRIHASLEEDVLLPAFRRISTNKDDARLTLEHQERLRFLEVAIGWIREPRIQAAAFSARARPGWNQVLAMIPVRLGRAPVKMVAWPGQVSVAL